MWAIAAAAFVAIFAKNVPFPAIVAAAAFIGYIGSRLAPHTFTVGGSHKKANESYGAALIDDDTLTPEHAVFRLSSLRRLLLAGGALWLASIALLMVSRSEMGRVGKAVV